MGHRAAGRCICALMRVAQCDSHCVLCLVGVTQGFYMALPMRKLARAALAAHAIAIR